jgi:hypothetical protein
VTQRIELGARSRSPRSQASTKDRRLVLVCVLKGSFVFTADLAAPSTAEPPHRVPRRAQLRRGHELERRRADHPGPLEAHRGRRHPHRRGHRRHGPHHRALARAPPHAQARTASRSARCSTSRRARASRCRSTTWASPSRTLRGRLRPRLGRAYRNLPFIGVVEAVTRVETTHEQAARVSGEARPTAGRQLRGTATRSSWIWRGAHRRRARGLRGAARADARYVPMYLMCGTMLLKAGRAAEGGRVALDGIDVARSGGRHARPRRAQGRAGLANSSLRALSSALGLAADATEPLGDRLLVASLAWARRSALPMQLFGQVGLSFGDAALLVVRVAVAPP